MSNAVRDENRITSFMGVSMTDGKTPMSPYANPTTHSLKVITTSGTDYGVKNAPRDENRVAVGMAVSSVDGVTPVTLYIDNSNNLLITN